MKTYGFLFLISLRSCFSDRPRLRAGVGGPSDPDPDDDAALRRRLPVHGGAGETTTTPACRWPHSGCDAALAVRALQRDVGGRGRETLPVVGKQRPCGVAGRLHRLGRSTLAQLGDHGRSDGLRGRHVESAARGRPATGPLPVPGESVEPFVVV